MRHRLLANKWNKKSQKYFITFQNSVLEIATGKLLPDAPGYRFTWCLPREYNPLAEGFPTIDGWLNEATGNNSAIKEVLLCYLNAILKGRADLQQFLYLIGIGVSGKSTIKLAEMLIGTENTRSTSLNDFGGNRFESAKVYKKRLVFFPEQDRYSRDLQKFKSLTGQDKISAEEKGKQAFQFEFDGMVILACNKEIFVGCNNSSWLTRRIIPITFDNPVPKHKRRDLTKEFEPELSGLTKYILSIPDEKVTQVLRNSVDDIPEVSAKLKEQRINSDSLAAWINECIIHNPEAFTPSGQDKDDTSSLFGNYYQYCLQAGVIPKSRNNFNSEVKDICNFELGWTDVKGTKKRVNTPNPVAVFSGLRLRTDNDNHIPYSFEECAGTTKHCSNTQNNPKPSQDKDCSDCSDCSGFNTTPEIIDDDSRIT
jgi:putative DNA primase/helicase